MFLNVICLVTAMTIIGHIVTCSNEEKSMWLWDSDIRCKTLKFIVDIVMTAFFLMLSAIIVSAVVYVIICLFGLLLLTIIGVPIIFICIFLWMF